MNDAAEFNSNISHPSQAPSEFEPYHELELPGQTGPHIVGEEGVIVVVVAVDRIDLSESAAPRRRTCKWSCRVTVEVEG